MLWKKQIKGIILHEYGSYVFALVSLKELADDIYNINDYPTPSYTGSSVLNHMLSMVHDKTGQHQHNSQLLHITIHENGKKTVEDESIIHAYKKLISIMPYRAVEKVVVLYEKEYIPEKRTGNKPGIPASAKTDCWKLYNGPDAQQAKCWVCQSTIIDVFNFHAGHILAWKEGGNENVENLRPICLKCNSSMSNTHMDYYKLCYCRDTVWPEPFDKKGGTKQQIITNFQNEQRRLEESINKRKEEAEAVEVVKKKKEAEAEKKKKEAEEAEKKKKEAEEVKKKKEAEEKKKKNNNLTQYNSWVNKLWKFVQDDWSGMISKAQNPQRPNFNEQHFKQCIQDIKNKDQYTCYKDLYNALQDVNKRIKNYKASKDFAKEYPDKWDKCLIWNCFIGLQKDFTTYMHYVDTDYS